MVDDEILELILTDKPSMGTTQAVWSEVCRRIVKKYIQLKEEHSGKKPGAQKLTKLILQAWVDDFESDPPQHLKTMFRRQDLEHWLGGKELGQAKFQFIENFVKRLNDSQHADALSVYLVALREREQIEGMKRVVGRGPFAPELPTLIDMQARVYQGDAEDQIILARLGKARLGAFQVELIMMPRGYYELKAYALRDVVMLFRGNAVPHSIKGDEIKALTYLEGPRPRPGASQSDQAAEPKVFFFEGYFDLSQMRLERQEHILDLPVAPENQPKKRAIVMHAARTSDLTREIFEKTTWAKIA